MRHWAAELISADEDDRKRPQPCETLRTASRCFNGATARVRHIGDVTILRVQPRRHYCWSMPRHQCIRFSKTYMPISKRHSKPNGYCYLMSTTGSFGRAFVYQSL